jgi:hypothetical protein
MWVVTKGIFSGAANPDGGKALFDPQGETTRAQLATMLMRFIENVM